MACKKLLLQHILVILFWLFFSYANCQQTTPVTCLSTGTSYCKVNNFGECLDLPEMRYNIQFECTCNYDTYWNRDNKICAQCPKCLSHTCPDPNSQECHEPYFINNETVRCKCKEAFITVSDGGNDNALRCERFDPCNVVHRNMSDNGNSPDYRPCGSSIASCVPIENFNLNIKRYYYCVCPKYFKTNMQKLNTDCISQFCELPLNKCQQKCDNFKQEPHYNCSCYENYYDYNKDQNSCIKKENKTCNCKAPGFCLNGDDDCHCKQGFNYQNGKTSDLCHNGHLNSSNGVAFCDCNDGYVLNKNNTCDYVYPCAQKPCHESAVCIINPNKITEHVCKCPYGTVFDNLGSLTDLNKTCVPVCDAKSRNDSCKSINAICNPLKVLNDPNGNVNFKGNYCECIRGYVNASTNNDMDCKVAKYSTEITLQIKNAFDNSVNKLIQSQSNYLSTKRFKRQVSHPDGYKYEELPIILVYLKEQEDSLNKLNAVHKAEIDRQQFIDELKTKIQHILDDIKYDARSITVDQCAPTQDNNYINCTFVIVTNGESRNKNLSKALMDGCRPIDGTNNCFFRFSATGEIFTLLTASITQEIGKLYEPCSVERRRTTCPGYATCVPSNKSNSYYSCICDPNYFTAYAYERLNVEDSTTNYTIQYCIVKNDQCKLHCPLSADPHGKCVQESPVYDTITISWKSDVKFCGCEEHYRIERNDRLLCTSI